MTNTNYILINNHLSNIYFYFIYFIVRKNMSKLYKLLKQNFYFRQILYLNLKKILKKRFEYCILNTLGKTFKYVLYSNNLQR